MFYSPSAKGFYAPEVNSQIPADAIELTEQLYAALKEGLAAGKLISVGTNDRLLLVEDMATSTAVHYCQIVDNAADIARLAVAGDPLRAVEYERAAAEAQKFTATGYQGDVPPMVAAWAIGGRTPKQAAVSILAKAAEYSNALVQLRATRLQAKEQIRAAVVAGNIEHALGIANEAVAAIEAAVAGIGNNT